MSKRLTATDIEQRLIDGNRPISLMSYGGNMNDRTSIWKCHICDHEWYAKASNIFISGTGCPGCSGHIPLTLEIIKQRLITTKRPITLLSYGNHSGDSSSLWKCHICDHEWSTTTTSVLSGRGCPGCSGNIPLTTEGIKHQLIDSSRPITLLSYGNHSGDSSSLWKCHECNHEWNATATSVLSGRGCPSCAGKIPLILETVKQRLIDSSRPITLLSYGINTTDKSSRWKCHDCAYEWTTSASNILGGKGCSRCADYGFNPGKPASFYIHTYNGFIKVGIARNLKQRHKKLDNQTVNETLYTIESTISWYFEKGSEAADLETTILDMFKPHAYTKLLETTFDGRTELFEPTIHQEMLDYIKDNYDISLV